MQKMLVLTFRYVTDAYLGLKVHCLWRIIQYCLGCNAEIPWQWLQRKKIKRTVPTSELTLFLRRATRIPVSSTAMWPTWHLKPPPPLLLQKYFLILKSIELKTLLPRKTIQGRNKWELCGPRLNLADFVKVWANPSNRPPTINNSMKLNPLMFLIFS